MNDRETLLNAIFFPRPSYKTKDEKDHLIEVEDDILTMFNILGKHIWKCDLENTNWTSLEL